MLPRRQEVTRQGLRSPVSAGARRRINHLRPLTERILTRLDHVREHGTQQGRGGPCGTVTVRVHEASRSGGTKPEVCPVVVVPVQVIHRRSLPFYGAAHEAAGRVQFVAATEAAPEPVLVELVREPVRVPGTGGRRVLAQVNVRVDRGHGDGVRRRLATRGAFHAAAVLARGST